MGQALPVTRIGFFRNQAKNLYSCCKGFFFVLVFIVAFGAGSRFGYFFNCYAAKRFGHVFYKPLFKRSKSQIVYIFSLFKIVLGVIQRYGGIGIVHRLFKVLGKSHAQRSQVANFYIFLFYAGAKIERNIKRAGSINKNKISHSIFGERKKEILLLFYRRQAIFPKKNQLTAGRFGGGLSVGIQQFFVTMHFIHKTIVGSGAQKVLFQLVGQINPVPAFAIS